MDIQKTPNNLPSSRKNYWIFISAGLVIIIVILIISLVRANNRMSNSSNSYRFQLGGKAERIEELEYEVERYKCQVSDLEDRVSELEDIIERAQDEMNTLVRHWNWEEDGWTISRDINNVATVLNEY